MYSNPPVHGARLVAEILSDEALSQEWSGECKVAKNVTLYSGGDNRLCLWRITGHGRPNH
ncbi:unnamed protein product, partial [Ectocarpus sp. 8 AP-2014]